MPSSEPTIILQKGITMSTHLTLLSFFAVLRLACRALMEEQVFKMKAGLGDFQAQESSFSSVINDGTGGKRVKFDFH